MLAPPAASLTFHLTAVWVKTACQLIGKELDRKRATGEQALASF